jgi:hypothetical protein
VIQQSCAAPGMYMVKESWVGQAPIGDATATKNFGKSNLGSRLPMTLARSWQQRRSRVSVRLPCLSLNATNRCTSLPTHPHPAHPHSPDRHPQAHDGASIILTTTGAGDNSRLSTHPIYPQRTWLSASAPCSRLLTPSSLQVFLLLLRHIAVARCLPYYLAGRKEETRKSGGLQLLEECECIPYPSFTRRSVLAAPSSEIIASITETLSSRVFDSEASTLSILFVWHSRLACSGLRLFVVGRKANCPLFFVLRLRLTSNPAHSPSSLTLQTNCPSCLCQLLKWLLIFETLCKT